MASTPSPSSTRLDPKIRYYVHRKHGNTIVPLIPADQLPFHLKDFPKNLNHRELSQGGWKYLEETSEIPFPLALLSPDVQVLFEDKPVQNVDSVVMPVKEAPMEKASPKQVAATETPAKYVSIDEGPAQEAPTKQPTKEAAPNAQKATSTIISGRPTHGKTNSLTDSMAAIYTNDAHRLGYTKSSSTLKRTVAAKDKENCRHWVKNGACKWTNNEEGCRYKQEIPSLEKLKEMGISELPGWFREKDQHSNDSIPNKAGEHTVPATCGTYTTNTADEPMLMDMDTNMSDMASVQDNVRIPPMAQDIAQDMPGDLQAPCTVAKPSMTSNSPNKSPVGPPVSASMPIQSADSSSGNLLAASGTTAPTPKLAPTLVGNIVNHHDISALAPARNPGPDPKSTSTKPASSSSPVASPRTNAPESTKTRLRPSSTSARPNPAHRQSLQSAQTKKIKANHATKRPTSRVANEDDDGAATLARKSTKHRSSPNKGCKVRVRQPDLMPRKKTGLVVIEEGEFGKTSSGFGSYVSAAVEEVPHIPCRSV
ncbi:uncharacterized protein N0V89_000950 [Didymosphaeria variabile]|uniref:Uncharacterized protein n=1 Tax=Didymosphaeria variabile TaxID=1932322 RepID=A0A9W8XVM3_9PLEO|nr:uncharacterized protein N0V89_000950 [Didymosphaeria variabile]KAJ4360388.1 hypothetical protein N0V89_000950 [Didymosphaeria variabile]